MSKAIQQIPAPESVIVISTPNDVGTSLNIKLRGISHFLKSQKHMSVFAHVRVFL